MSNQNKFNVTSSDKLGLALSGGGFRAALFHIGTLARLAELDLLKHVRVLSTVSGGSIIGAMYYLKLKQLLEEKRPDGLKPSKAAYIKLVEELEEEFLQGVRTNIRVRLLLNPFKNAKFLLCDDYSRSDRLSELYHETFYRPIWSSESVTLWDWLLDVFCIKDSRAILLKELKIYPPGTQVGFNIHTHNQTAEYKIPMLAINATTLNSGEHWKFTASSVGVQDGPGENHPSVTLYPQLFFGDAGLTQVQRNKLDSLTLSDAVAASACVPALFTPLPIHDLYPPIQGNEVVVELVDGGVFDNQGLTTLKDENCTHVICSDGSGQLQFDRTPSSDEVAVMFQSNNVLQERIRSLETDDLKNGPTVGFWHLRGSFQSTKDFPAFSGPATTSDEKSNGQIFLLSSLRTDLDAFSDIEANALMYDAYCLCDSSINQSAGLNTAPTGKWKFLNIRNLITGEPEKLIKHLNVGEQLFFKTFRLMGLEGRILGGTLIAFALAVFWWILTYLIEFLKNYFSMISNPAVLAGMIILGLTSWFILKNLPKRIRMLQKAADTIRKIRTGNVLGSVYLFALITGIVSAIALLYLTIVNPIYLKLGKNGSSSK